MILALLDCPGSLTEILATSHGSQVLIDFVDLLRNERLDPVPFLTPEELNAWRVNPPPGLRTARGAIERLLMRIVRWEGGTCQATLTSGPGDLSAIWKCGLRDAMSQTNDWRSPQIIVPSSRRRDWPNGSDVEIWIQACIGAVLSGPHNRVIAELETYPDHPHARADVDPWNLAHRHPVPNPRVNHMAHPCLLPKPPKLANVSLSQLEAELRTLKQEEGDKLYYLPRRNWSPVSITKEDWRSGRAFPYDQIDGHCGFVDLNGIIWEWDNNERHWDVQSKPYRRISHTGDEIGR